MRYGVALTLFLAGCGQNMCAGSGCGGSPDLGAAPDLTGAPAPTYGNFAQNFFATYCVRCHPSPTESPRDFTQYAIIKSNSANIRCGVSPTLLSGCTGTPAPSQFPIGNGPVPSDAERNQLVAWIEAGLPQ
jgi:hypothetical protein